MDIGEALHLAKRGDRTAFADLVGETQALVFSIAWHFMQDRAVAEEIAQDIFLEFYRNISKIESPAHMTFWLRRCTANRCIDQSRKMAYRTEIPFQNGFHPATSGHFSDTFLDEALRRQIAKLPEWQRAVVILRYQEDLDTSEIAEVLGIPVNTVKSRLHRAIGSLRETLERKTRVQL